MSSTPMMPLEAVLGPPPVTKQQACNSCKKSKVKCRGATATGPAFPCARCIRLKLPCEDPQKAPISDPNSRLTDLTRSLLKRLESNTPVDRERLERLMGLFALVYRRKVKTGAIKPDGVAAQSLVVVMKAVCAQLGIDADAYTAQLSGLGGAEGVVVEGHYLSHYGPRGQAMHPWIAALFDDTTSAIAIVTIHGEDRFYCNDSFARAFGFDEHQANKWLKDEALTPPMILSIPVHPSEKARMTKNMTEMLVDSVSPVVEQRQIYKVRLAGLNVSVMALFWNRFMLVERGDYLASVLSLSPLPMHAAPSKRAPQGSRRANLQCSREADPWLVAAEVFGERDEQPADQEQQEHQVAKDVPSPTMQASTMPVGPVAAHYHDGSTDLKPSAAAFAGEGGVGLRPMQQPVQAPPVLKVEDAPDPMDFDWEQLDGDGDQMAVDFAMLGDFLWGDSPHKNEHGMEQQDGTGLELDG